MPEKMKIVLVKTEGVLFVGMEESTDHSILNKPRMVFANHETGAVNLAPCIADPESIVIGSKPHFSYYSNDPQFDEFYLNIVNPKEESPIIQPNPGKVVKIIK